MKTTPFHRWTAALLRLSVCAALSGCGSDGSEDPDPDAATTKVSIVFPARGATYADVLVGVQEGIFEKHGIDLEMLPDVSNSTALVQAVAGGDADLTGTALSTLFDARDSGVEIQVLAQTTDTLASAVVVTKEWAAEQAEKGITPDSPPEEKVEALEGATMGLSARGTGTETFYNKLFDYYDIPYGGSTFVALGGAQGMDAGLRSKQVDTIYTAIPDGYMPEAGGYGVVWLQSKDYKELPPWQYGSQAYIASSTWLAENPDTAEQFLEAINEARDFIRDDPDAAAQAFLKQVPDFDEELTERAIETVAELYGDADFSQGYFDQNKAFYDASAEKPSTTTYEEAAWQGGE